MKTTKTEKNTGLEKLRAEARQEALKENRAAATKRAEQWEARQIMRKALTGR